MLIIIHRFVYKHSVKSRKIAVKCSSHHRQGAKIRKLCFRIFHLCSFELAKRLKCLSICGIMKARKEMIYMKLFKSGTILQLIYCSCCLLVVICMPLYTAFYTTTFGKICFRMGAILTFVSTFNPMGLIGTVCNFIACFFSDLKKSKKILIWTIISPAVIVLFWVLAVCFFVYHSGGV